MNEMRRPEQMCGSELLDQLRIALAYKDGDPFLEMVWSDQVVLGLTRGLVQKIYMEPEIRKFLRKLQV